MVQLNIRVPRQLRDAVHLRAVELGHQHASDYVRALLERDTADGRPVFEPIPGQTELEAAGDPPSPAAEGLSGREKMEAQGPMGVAPVDVCAWLQRRGDHRPRAILVRLIERGEFTINGEPHYGETIEPGRLGGLVKLEGRRV